VKVEFLKDFEAKTTTGIRHVSIGTVLDLVEDKARRLIAAGVAVLVTPFNPESLPYMDKRGRLITPFNCPPKYRYWAGGQSIKETLKEIFEERAAIMEFDGGLTREAAEEEAARIVTRYVQSFENQ
jgi:hypothetical protein